MKSLVTNLQRLSLALLAVIVVVFCSFTVLTSTASAAMYVGNLSYEIVHDDSYEIVRDDLKQVFSEYGRVKSVQVLKDRETGKLKGFAFVEMETDAEEAVAIEALDGAEWMGRNLKVNKVTPKEDRGGDRRGNNTGGGRYRW